MAFLDLGDQFLAVAEGRRQGPDEGRHFGLVVDDREAVRSALTDAGIEPHGGRGLRFSDPGGNQFEIVEYADVQFSKTAGVLRGMGLEGLEKSDAARAELADKGLVGRTEPLTRRYAALVAVLATVAATATAEAKRLVRNDAAGGLAGTSERLIVAGDGTARHSVNGGHERRFKVSATRLRGLRFDLKERALLDVLACTTAPRTSSMTASGSRWRSSSASSVSVSSGERDPGALRRVDAAAARPR